MEWMLDAMVLVSPIGLAIIGCVAFGFALAAREALGRERGLHEATKRARDAAIKTLAGNKDWEMQEIDRYRRLLDCHVDALIAEATDFRERSVPSPGAIIESLCSWHADWKQFLASCAGLPPAQVEMLLKNDLPITPTLARRLEIFTGAPARYWERLWRLHDEYRIEVDATLVARLGDVTSACKAAAHAPAPAPASSPSPATDEPGIPAPLTRRDQRRVLEIVGDDSPTTLMAAPLFPPEPVASSTPPPPAPRSAPAELPLPRPVRRSPVEVHPPVVPHPEIVARGQRGGLPPPPVPRLRSPAGPGPAPARRAATLTDFPIQTGDAASPGGEGWAEAERSPLNATLRGVGG